MALGGVHRAARLCVLPSPLPESDGALQPQERWHCPLAWRQICRLSCIRPHRCLLQGLSPNWQQVAFSVCCILPVFKTMMLLSRCFHVNVAAFASAKVLLRHYHMIPSALGAQFKAKKAGGDVKGASSVEPYAYWPLDRKMLNRRPSKTTSAKAGLDAVINRSSKASRKQKSKHPRRS